MVCIPWSQKYYERVVDDPGRSRHSLDRHIEDTRDLPPTVIRLDYRMKDVYHSRKTGHGLRRIGHRDLRCYLVRPSFLMPYLSGDAEDVQPRLLSSSSPPPTGP